VGNVCGPLSLGRPNFILAASPPLSHNALMPKVPTITLRIEADLLTQVRFRWLLCEGDKVLLRCQHSFETKGEAEADGNKALQKRIDELRAPPSSK
jgi:hypothetical protein